MNSSLITIGAFLILLGGCKHKGVEADELSNIDSIKNIILRLNSAQQELYRSTFDKQERSKRYLRFCHDSLLTITGYGNQLTNSLDASNDLVDGYADTIHSITIRIYDNTAILTGKAKMYVLVGRDTLYEDIWISKVFINEKGQWKMVLRNSGPLAVNYRKEKILPAELLLKYAGAYGLQGEVSDTFRVEENHLYQVGPRNLKLKYYAYNDSSFFTKDDLGSIVFRKQAGRISHFDWHTPDGQVFQVPKTDD